MTERRYSEDEVAAIFERAVDVQRNPQRQIASREGMTLSELQQIGSEVGIPAELVAQAARSLGEVAPQPPRSFLGLPIGVGRTVDLGRRLSEREWERLVVDLRETFDARGHVRVEGSFRQWTNGNLQALLEPTPTGHRLRLRTIRGESRSLMVGGLGILGVACATVFGAVLAGGLGDPGALTGVGFLSVVGAGMFGLGALRLPGWARLRGRQMEAIAERLMMAAPSPESTGE